MLYNCYTISVVHNLFQHATLVTTNKARVFLHSCFSIIFHLKLVLAPGMLLSHLSSYIYGLFVDKNLQLYCYYINIVSKFINNS